MWDRANWTPAESSDRQRIWRNDAGDLMVQQFGREVPRGLPLDWRDAEALRACVTANPSPKLAFVSIDVVTLACGVVAARYVHKEHMPPPSLGMQYVGMLALPFERFFTNVLFAGMEHGTTGTREAVLAATGKVRMQRSDGPPPVLTNEQVERMYDEFRNATPRRLASDDEQWDDLFPQHPLSRVRGHLRGVQETMTVDEVVRRARPFGV
jgi:hypothetical protein